MVRHNDEDLTCEAIRAETQRNYAQMLLTDENIDGASGRNATVIGDYVVGILLVGPMPVHHRR